MLYDCNVVLVNRSAMRLTGATFGRTLGGITPIGPARAIRFQQAPPLNLDMPVLLAIRIFGFLLFFGV